MDPEDPFAGLDPETIRRGSLRTLHAMFPELFPPDPNAEPQEPSAEHPVQPDEEDERDPQPDEEEEGGPRPDKEGMRHLGGLTQLLSSS